MTAKIKAIVSGVLLALMLSLSACTLGEAMLGAGAAGLGGYVIGRERSGAYERRYERCDHYRYHTVCR